MLRTTGGQWWVHGQGAVWLLGVNGGCTGRVQCGYWGSMVGARAGCSVATGGQCWVNGWFSVHFCVWVLCVHACTRTDVCVWTSTLQLIILPTAPCLRRVSLLPLLSLPHLSHIGAGKTTTFNILTGDLSATAGTAIIAGYDIRTSLREVLYRVEQLACYLHYALSIATSVCVYCNISVCIATSLCVCVCVCVLQHQCVYCDISVCIATSVCVL